MLLHLPMRAENVETPGCSLVMTCSSETSKHALGVVFVLLLLDLSCSSPSGSVETESLSRRLIEPPFTMASTTNKEQPARLAGLWVGLLSDNIDQQKLAIEMLRDDPSVAKYPFHAKLKWVDNTHLAPVVEGKVLDFYEWRSEPLWQQVIPALSARISPFTDWEPDACTHTLSALLNCATNLRRFARSLDLVSVPQGETLQPQEVSLLSLQFDICIKTAVIREVVILSVEQAQMPGFDAETLQQLLRELKEDRSMDSELFGKLQQARKRWSEELNHLIQLTQSQ